MATGPGSRSYSQVAVWLSGNGSGQINDVTLHWAQLPVLFWWRYAPLWRTGTFFMLQANSVKINLRHAVSLLVLDTHYRSVLRWVTVHGYATSECNHLPRPTQPPTVSGTGNEYQPRAVAVLCSWEGNGRSGSAASHTTGVGLRKGDDHHAHTPVTVWHPSCLLSCWGLSAEYF